ncbi:MAG: sigma-70 family RNA polymerase sigma factor [Armatimonadetes bacterium]|nr:sigma-70 family RNA polymerase sigma factor [Armatimonadota bacterium]
MKAPAIAKTSGARPGGWCSPGCAGSPSAGGKSCASGKLCDTPLGGSDADRFLAGKDRLARRLLKRLLPWAKASDMEAEDLLIEIRIAFLLARDRFDPAHPRQAALDTFLWAYARRYVLHRIRDRCNLLGIPQNAPGRLSERALPLADTVPERACEEAGFAEAELSALIAQLPPKLAAVAKLLAEGWGKGEIARVFGYSPQWMESALAALRVRLKRLGWP